MSRRRSGGSKTMVSVVIGLMMSVAIGAILVNSLSTTLTDRMTNESSSEFNNTVGAIIAYTWITFGLLALGILIVGAVFILQQVNLL
jgi:ABC-type nickel/cobalt efflux system permease component RcnA